MYDLIIKKRNGGELSGDEIYYMTDRFTAGEIPDYQMSAMMMAIYFRGMNERETLDLTLAMAKSGDMLDLGQISGIKVDKHSTGGVGDKTSLALMPMVASLGVKVAKMSGRGLGHTGGTIDKLESFDGFTTEITEEKFKETVNRVGMSIMGQTADLAPADKKLYALRDVTATVDNLSLIASSIMSKKLALGADAIVLDVKTGSGAFMKEEEDAFALAREMVRIGKGAGINTVAVVSDMDQPLGYAVGNILEVREAIDTLNGKGPDDFVELCLTLGSQMLLCAKITDSEKKARELLKGCINDGSALEKLAQFVEAQGGNRDLVYNPQNFPKAEIEEEILSDTEGYVQKIICDEVGSCSLMLGGGRETKDSVIDLTVGIVLHKKVGDYVRKGESIATMYANDSDKLEAAKKRLIAAYSISGEKTAQRKLIKGCV